MAIGETSTYSFIVIEYNRWLYYDTLKGLTCGLSFNVEQDTNTVFRDGYQMLIR